MEYPEILSQLYWAMLANILTHIYFESLNK